MFHFLSVSDVAARRLQSQRLVGERFGSAVDAVGWLGAVQSQDYAASKWALGQRTEGALEADIDRLFDEGAILRTHVLRPTWHFVLPEDIRWIQELTSSRVLAGLKGRYRQLELDDRTVAKAIELLGEAVSSRNFLTRNELAVLLRRAGVSSDGQRMPHLLAAAEHAAVLTSGPRRDKQFTYALLEERAPTGARSRDRDEALCELALRYFRSRGPAQIQDFVWWSGLTAADGRRGIELAGEMLQSETIDGKEHWQGVGDRPAIEVEPLAHLLPNFDEFTVAYRDRSAVLDPAIAYNPTAFAHYRESSPQGGILSNVVTIAGRLRGAWSRTLVGQQVRVEIRPLAPLSRDQAMAVVQAAGRFAHFLRRDLGVEGI